jgi:signal transduction histidine kinase
MTCNAANTSVKLSASAICEETTARLKIVEAATEASKTRLTRVLHDDVGTLLGGAVMDIAWAENRAEGDSELLERLRLIKQSLTKAIVLKRQVIEEICPTLIENVGLVAALRWHHRQQCLSADLRCDANYPEREMPFSPAAARTLFRIFEEAFVLVTRQPSATSAHVSVETSRHEITIRVSHDGDPMALEQRTEADLTSLWLVEHRVRGLGGTLTVQHPAHGGMELQANVPLKDIVTA